MTIRNCSMCTCERVLAIVAEVLAIESNALSLDSRLQEDLGTTSMDAMTLILALEDEFGRKMSLDEVQQLRTVRDVAQYIETADRVTE